MSPDAPAVKPPPQREAELARQGWTRRSVAAPGMLREMADLYRSLGFEVLLEPLAAQELADECRACALPAGLFKVVYTRPARSGS